MKTLWHNGNIYLSKNNFCEAMIVADNKIIATGSTTALKKMKYDKLHDLQRQTVIPGLNDTHLHFLMTAQTLDMVDITTASSIAEIIKRTKAYLKERKFTKTQILYSEGWNDAKFTDFKRPLNRHDLDAISLTNPIFMTRVDRHIAVANTAGLKLMGAYSKNFVSPTGGEIVLGDDGYPTGLIKEMAQLLYRTKLPKHSPEKNLQILRNTIKVANQLGLTSVHTCDLVDDQALDTYQLYATLDQTKELSVRFYHQCWMSTKALVTKFLTQIKEFKNQSDFNKIGSVKLFADGSLGGRTAGLIHPYHDDSSTKGILYYTEEALTELVKMINGAKIQVVIHAIGDGAIELVLKAYGNVNAKANPLRNAVIHVQITDQLLLEKFMKTKVLAYVQPVFLDDDLQVLETRVGKPLAKTSYAFKTLIKGGVHVSLGTDAPVCTFNPWDNIYCAINRTRLNGEPVNGYERKREGLDIFEAIDAYTIEGAYASFEEEHKGRIAEGYLADFVVLNQNIFKLKDVAEIRKTHAITTVVNGQVVYSK